MSGVVVPLRWTATDRPSLRLRALTGAAELAVTATDLDAAIGLIDALGEPDAIDAADLATPDRDRVIAGLLEATNGPLIESTLTCRQCGESFELSFDLPELVRYRTGEQSAGTPGTPIGGTTPGRWVIDGIEFRFPTARDERIARRTSCPAATLRDRCISVDGPSEAQLSMVEAEMARIAPLLSAEIGGACPDCGEAHAVTFDVQRYTLALIRLGRDRLLGDVHLIASTYGWSRAEILTLDRDERNHYVELIARRTRSRVIR